MPDGIYSAAAGMAAQQTRLDAIANDLANVNTPGYSRERIAFEDLVYNRENGVPVGAGAAAISLGSSFTPGPLAQTGDPLSLALDGPGFFQVKRADGSVALTRAGDFVADDKGEVVTKSGERLVPPLQLPPGTDPAQLTIAADGTVTLQGKTIGKISIVTVPAPAALQPVGDGYAPTTASGKVAGAPATTKVLQGSLEGSNVDIGQTMVDMIDAQRAYELASRAIKQQDQLLDTVNQIRR
jgi:flagellar basal-body rod protein FlgG